MNNDEKIIKENYGEEMWGLCEKLFPEYLKEPGKISKIMLEYFSPTFSLYDDITLEKMEDSFKNFICSAIDQSNFDAKKGMLKLASYLDVNGKFYKVIGDYKIAVEFWGG